MAKRLDDGIIEIIEDCHEDDWSSFEIRDFFKDEFQLKIPYSIICCLNPALKGGKRRDFNQKPKKNKYYRNPEVKAKNRARQKKYYKKYYERPFYKDYLYWKMCGGFAEESKIKDIMRWSVENFKRGLKNLAFVQKHRISDA